jgi:hypothetical protein
MDEELRAYEAGRADGAAARRDEERATDRVFGKDYRIGFLDGRLEVFRLNAGLRRIAEETE